MMVGKNNKTVQLEKSATRRSKYSIKKLSVGVVSVAVGATLSLGVSSVHAEEVFVETSETSTADSIDQTFEVANHDEEIELSDNAISDGTDHNEEIELSDDAISDETDHNEEIELSDDAISDETDHNEEIELSDDAISDETDHNEEIELSDDALPDETVPETSTESVQINSPQVDLQLLPVESEEVSVTPLHEDNESVLETPIETPTDSLSEVSIDTHNSNLVTDESINTEEESDVHVTSISEVEVDIDSEESLQITSISKSSADITPPKVISITPGKNIFNGNESRNLFVEIEEANDISYLDFVFLNNDYDTPYSYYDKSNYFSFYYHNYGNELTRNEAGNYVLELINNDYNRYGNYAGVYELFSYQAEDDMGNSLYEEQPNISASFEYYEYEGQDITDPVFKSITTDKETYHAGEKVEISMLVEEDKTLRDVNLTFINEGYFGPSNFSVYNSDTAVIREISAGLFEFKGSIILPAEMGPTTYELDSFIINNLNSSRWEDDFPDFSFTVVNDAVQEVITEYQTFYTTSWDEVSEGSNGLKYVLEDGTEKVIHEAINAVKMYDNEYITTDYETIWIENYDSQYYGGHSWLQYGQNGSKTVYYDSLGNIVEEHIHQEAVDEIIVIDLAEYKEIEPETIYIPNNDLEIGFTQTSSYGEYGRKKVIYDLEGNVVSEEILEESSPHIIEVGTFEYISIPYEVVYEEDPNRIEGSVWDETVEFGSNGLMKRIYDLSGNIVEEIIITPAINEIIKTGTIKLTPIPYDTIYTTWQEGVREGSIGGKYIFPDGSEYIEYYPISEIRLYDYVDEPEVYWTQYKPNYDLEPGLSKITQSGENGIVRYFYNELGQRFDYITIQPTVAEIIEYGVSKEAELEDQNASKNIKNKIDVIDIDTGHRITSIDLDGYSYYDRMLALIDQLNNTFGYKLTSEYTERISSNPKHDIFNGQYVELNEDIYYVKNQVEQDIRDYELPLIPDWQLDYGYGLDYFNGVLNIFDEESQLLTFNFDHTKSIDQLIKNGLALLDKEKYFFERFETPLPYNMYAPRLINVFVRERLEKTLTEEAFGTDYTNDPSEVRDGQNGTKYVYSDGSERIATPPINKIILVDTELSDSLIIDSISVDKEKYAINDNVEVTIVGRNKAAIKDLTIDFSDWSKRKMHYVRGNTSENITHEDGVFTSKILINIHDYVKNSNFTFDNLIAKDIYGNVTEFWTKWESLDDEPYFEIIDEPFHVGFKTTDVTLLGVNPVEFDTEYTTDEAMIREGIKGSKLVYSDGSEVILTDAVSEVVLYDNEIAEIEPDTEFTIYAHEVRAGIKGSKLVFSNGEERVLEAPVSAIALYQNKVEEFDYTTLTVESSDMSYGDRRIIQEGILGRRAVFYDAEGNIVDSLIVSAPVSRIEQVGANKQTLVLTPFDTQYTTDSSLVRSGQNGTKYIYSDGREEQLTEAVSAIQLYRYADEAVAFKEITHDNSQLAKGETKVIIEGQPGLNRLFYDENGKVIEVQIITKAIDQVLEVGTLDSIEVVDEDKELPDNPNDSDNDTSPEESSGNDNESLPDESSDSDNGSLPDESSGNDNETLPDESQEEDNKPSTPSIEDDSSENEKIDDSIKPNDSSATLNAASVLPNTGEHPSSVWLTLGAVSLLSGFGLIATGKRKSTKE
ncbi:YSIRK-type signal peptide-containing protein [Aerococcaceae bacterium WS4759]|uniref:YSIRK-type signal peptide-containing protein n=1 Tax=Fundicoccus ignavus TaxID=2664442 RepID=A0A6I2GW92_9LACT|nr:G5 domain-containing protein [Fundicoccus ignavus]MRI84613.1 YSIRK-type signal peptide-containing protein [Fundicoccus ignavus]